MLIGTLGAVIRIRGAIPSRKALFDIAAAGPIAGFVLALPLLAWGLATATVLPESTDLHGASLGPPLSSWILERWLYGDATIQVGSIYGAAWVGMLITSMNLFPVGQLDGGHALFAISPKAHRKAAFATIAAVADSGRRPEHRHRSPSAYSLWLVVLFGLGTVIPGSSTSKSRWDAAGAPSASSARRHLRPLLHRDALDSRLKPSIGRHLRRG